MKENNQPKRLKGRFLGIGGALGNALGLTSISLGTHSGLGIALGVATGAVADSLQKNAN